MAEKPVNIENTNEKINLIYFSGTGSIWNTSDWRKIIEKRMGGQFVGNLPQHHQVKEKGFPLLLSRNETKLLLEMNQATLNFAENLLKMPSEELKRKYREFRKDSFSKQIGLLKSQREKEILDKADVIISGKLSKRPRLLTSKVSDQEKDSIIQEQLGKITDPAEEYLYHQISTEDCLENLELVETVNWSYPETHQEKLEYETYRVLHAMGYWITPGIKFGGNFLVYPGSPLQCHARYIIRCVSNPNNISPFAIVAFTRLAHSTRKIPVFAYQKSDKSIKFQSINWISD